MASTYYYASYDHSGATAAIPPEALLSFTPFVFGKSCTLDRIGADISVVGTSGAVVRLGIYRHDAAAGLPGDLLLDAGTIDGTSATFQAITISQQVDAGLYWVAAVVQGVAGTRPTLRVYQNMGSPPYVGFTTGGTATSRAAYNRASVTGALPTPASPTGTTAFTALPIIWLRAT